MPASWFRDQFRKIQNTKIRQTSRNETRFNFLQQNYSHLLKNPSRHSVRSAERSLPKLPHGFTDPEHDSLSNGHGATSKNNVQSFSCNDRKLPQLLYDTNLNKCSTLFDDYDGSGGLFLYPRETNNSASLNGSPDLLRYKRFQISDSDIDIVFDVYRDPSRDVILTAGVEKFCADLLLRPDDFRILILAWYFGAETMCRFTRFEFQSGFKKLRVRNMTELQDVIFQGCTCQIDFSNDVLESKQQSDDQTPTSTKETKCGLKSRTESQCSTDNDRLYGCIYPNYRSCTCNRSTFTRSVTCSRDKFRDLYKWAYRFSLDMDTGQRTLPLDVALSMWRLIFSQNLNFLSQRATSDATKSSLLTQANPDLNSSDRRDGIVCDRTAQTNTCCQFDDVTNIESARNESRKEARRQANRFNTETSSRQSPSSSQQHQHRPLLALKSGAKKSSATRLISMWLRFLEDERNANVRGITRDTWEMLLTFVEMVRDVRLDYDENEAWPSLFDDFVEWFKEVGGGDDDDNDGDSDDGGECGGGDDDVLVGGGLNNGD
ncbi:hypothetical protein HELRODRAFT_177056 [Helobdella robusta]|uniref:Defective in cullin neddylation protein n=1 Tax=Helobdella robusta TaxID=6412 RepID=T1FB67_HELRO|nr:hypothetical protein HELRODRAFT_177056 [Helobdella robusta]ESN98577.1 hypothetical protein HELRODRAFT_177056 [Helobdella robusta]